MKSDADLTKLLELGFKPTVYIEDGIKKILESEAKKILINGGAGFLGSNLSHYALKNGIDLIIFDNLSRAGSEENLKWLETLGKFKFIKGDVRDNDAVKKLVKVGLVGSFFKR